MPRPVPITAEDKQDLRTAPESRDRRPGLAPNPIQDLNPRNDQP